KTTVAVTMPLPVSSARLPSLARRARLASSSGRLTSCFPPSDCRMMSVISASSQRLSVRDGDRLDVLAQVAVEISDERLQELPIRAFAPRVDLGDENATHRLVPPDPSRMLYVLPAPLAAPPERRRPTTQRPLLRLE